MSKSHKLNSHRSVSPIVSRLALCKLHSKCWSDGWRPISHSHPLSPAEAGAGGRREGKGRGRKGRDRGVAENIFSSEDLEAGLKEEAAMSKRQMTCRELLETERNYVHNLNVLYTVFMLPLKETARDTNATLAPPLTSGRGQTLSVSEG